MAITGLYAGSFDPLTLGHLDIIIRASHVVDRLIVVVGQNNDKRYLLPEEARLDLVRSSLDDSSSKLGCRIDVVLFHGLTTDCAHAHHAQVLVRGLRNDQDLALENAMAAMNKTLAPDLETIFLTTSPEFSHISSTLVRDIIKHGGDISAFVPRGVVSYLAKTKR